MNNHEQNDLLVSRIKNYLMIRWLVVYILVAGLFLYPFFADRGQLTQPVPRLWENIFFILLVLVLAAIYYIKRSWLNRRILNKISEGKLDTSKSFGLPLSPFELEPDTAGGVLYYIRRSLTLIYLFTFLGLVVVAVYFFLFHNRFNVYLYCIILMLPLFINFPRKQFFEYFIESSKEDSYDSQ